MSGTIPPLAITSAGPTPTPPATLNAALIALAQTYAPGLTVLPAGLIEDLASTATGALVVIDQARVDLIASVSPNTANPYILALLGQVYGVPQGVGANTGVFVVFTVPASVGPGLVIPAGFIVSDGTYQYSIQDAGVIGSTLSTQPLSALATQAGSWSVPVNTVTQIVTSVPSTIAGITVTNPLAGSPGLGAQSEESYRSAVLQAGQASATGMPAMLRTLLGNVTGVNTTQIAIQAQSGGGWKIIVGGSGDPYQIGFAIWQSIFDVSTLVGSTLTISGATNANPCVITTSLNHGYTGTQNVVITGALGLTLINGSYLATVLSPTTFSIPVNATTGGTYTGGGVVTPNFRNVTTSISNYPDVYMIPFVVPPAQTVSMVVTWNTNSVNFVSPAAIAAAAQPALALYINTVAVGQPINLFTLQETFQQAVAPLLAQPLLTRLVFAISINGIGVSPLAGTFLIEGDPESYFTTTTAAIVVNQG
jgi:hypothetical protein